MKKFELSEDLIKALHTEISEDVLRERIEKEVPELFPRELEVGRWYWVDRMVMFGPEEKALINFQKGDCYGFDHEGKYITAYGNPKNHKYLFTPATNEEVQTALIAEAKKRGFKESRQRVKADFILKHEVITTSIGFFFINNKLLKGNYPIFHNGKWATIIEEPAKKLTVSEIEKLLGHKIEIVG